MILPCEAVPTSIILPFRFLANVVYSFSGSRINIFVFSVAKFAIEKGIAYFPGCVTPTEIMQALDLGINIVKFFPANVYGGLKALKALSAPFPQVKFIPTGGADLSNLTEFLEFDKVYAVGGSFMMKGDIVENCKKINELL